RRRTPSASRFPYTTLFRSEKKAWPLLALVGYTSAGKSTLFKAITGTQVETSERLFATLDPALRRVVLPNRQEVFLVDTVGFIRRSEEHTSELQSREKLVCR